MGQLGASGENAEQIKYWNGEAGTHWADHNDEMDTMLRPLGATAIDRAAPAAGEHVLDIGCGCGGTTLDLAEHVGESGRILGVDISETMLGLANKRIGNLPAKLQAVPSFALADASTFTFPKNEYDLLFSRFGVMFFADSTAAFANMRQALKPKGRLTFLCWGPPSENDWITTPLMAAREHLPPTEATDPKAPGPFAFADTDYVGGILAAAGFANIHVEATSPVMKIGRGGSVEDTAEFFMEVGPVARALIDQNDSVRGRVKNAIADTIADRFRNGFAEMGARCWIVSGENSA